MFSTCDLVATSTWPGFTWPMSMKASVSPSSWTSIAGISFATILQNTQFASLFTLGLLVTVAAHAEKLAVLESHRGQRAAPDATAVAQRKPRLHLEPERRPVSRDQRRLLARAQVEPRLES